MEIATRRLDHLGVVAGIFDEIGISEVVDYLIPKNRDHKLSHSIIIKALILNGLGFLERRLYIFPEYFEGLAVDRLFGEGISPGDFNEDVIGRTLDRIKSFGSTELFNEIVLKVMEKFRFGNHLLHIDTTSFSVHGDYENSDGFSEIKITYGHPKDSRWDLKQFVLSMVTNQYGIPLCVKAHSGNKSDKKTIMETIKRLKENLNFDDKIYRVSDAAFFTGKNVEEMRQHTFWVTRVPASVKEAKELLFKDLEMKPCKDNRYSFFETQISYKGIDQKWVVIDSKEMHAKKAKTFDKNIEKEYKTAQISLNKLMRTAFACETDARITSEQWIKEHPHYRFKEFGLKTLLKRPAGCLGRPRKDEQLQPWYLIEATIEPDEEVIAKERSKLGRFVLASNDIEIDPEQLLQFYKGQGSVERGFRFLKDKSFRVAEVYLKNEGRIEALSMIMVLSLLVYSIAEWMLRTRLQETGETVLNQLKKPTQRPTMKWIFFKFRGVDEAEVHLDHRIFKQVINMKEELHKILRLLGPSCEKYYV